MNYKHSRRVNGIVVSVAASALLSLFLVNNQVQADTQPPVDSQTTTIVENQSADDEAKDVPVVTNQDHYSKPNDKRQWSNPADYKDDIPVQVLGINDVHGNIDKTGKAWVGRRPYQNAGNIDRLAGYLNNAEASFKKKNPNGTTFRVEAGDMVGASPATSSLLQDEPTMKALKAMHVNIGTLGNHEFDEGLGEFHRIVTGQAPKKGQFNEVEENYPHTDSGLEIVVANLVNKSDGQVPFGWKPYVVKEVEAGDKKAKIGFIGIETTDLPKLTFAKNIKDYQVLDEAESIAKYDKVLQDQGVHAIVVLAHTGIETYKGKTSGDAVKILQKLYRIDPNNSVDLYIAGHSHQYANATVGHTKIVQATSFSKAYDDAIGYLDPKTQDFAAGSLVTHVYPVMSAEQDPRTEADPAVTAIVKDAQDRTAKITDSVIGKAATAKSISKDLNNNFENAVGDLVVDAQMAEAKRKGIPVDVALTNGGGVRSELTVESDGSIKWKSAQAVQPFSNQIQVFAMKGQKLYDILNSQYAASNQNRYYLLSGMHYVYTTQDNKDFPKKVAVIYDSDNHPVDPDKEYRVLTSNYLVDSTKEFKGAKKVADVGIDTDLFVDYLKHQTEAGKLIAAPELDRKQEVSVAEAAKLIEAAQAELKPKQEANKPSQAASEKSKPEAGQVHQEVQKQANQVVIPIDQGSVSTNQVPVPTTKVETTKDNPIQTAASHTENVVKIVLTHNAFVYQANGKLALRLGERVLLRKGEYVHPLNNGKRVKIHDKEFYQIGENAYVKVANTVKRVKRLILRHNAYVYDHLGKVVKHGKKRLLLKKGRKFIDTNSVVKIRGQQFYQIGKNRFVKVANF